MVITAAVAMMIAVFMSFVLGDLRVLKLMGLGLATAIFIDASIVRMVLVPATMELLGKANWWLPDWLDRVLPRISVEAPPDFTTLHGEPADGVRSRSRLSVSGRSLLPGDHCEGSSQCPLVKGPCGGRPSDHCDSSVSAFQNTTLSSPGP
ncbi:MAG: hypothetical protein NVSMB60_34090 [Mycobacterium sp.]